MTRLILALLLVVALQPPGRAVGPRLIVLNKDDATLAVIDPATGRTLGTVPTGEAPHEAAVSEDGRMAFAANYGAQTPGSTISVIDLTTMKELRRVDVSPLRRPHGLFVRNGGLYFTAETNRIIGRYDPGSNTIDWLLGSGQAGTHMIWVNHDATKMVTCNIGSNSLTIYERGANALAWNEAVVAVGRGPEGFDVSPDGRQVWAAHSRDGGVSIVDLDQKKVIETIDVHTKVSNRLKFTPDGKTVLISDDEAGEVLVIDVGTRTVTKKIPAGKGSEGILMPPDGGYAYVAVNAENHIAVVDLKTLTVVRTIDTGRGPDGMAWVPGR
ncbi:MAG TPA: beta-propeller fold lactonase family protein [Vicinamibacterales bacterium]|jgi:YVTN family beta-propeller protein